MLFVEAKPSEERNSGRDRPHPMCDKSRMNLVHMKAPIESGCKSILKTLPHLRPPDHRKRRQSQEPRNRWDSPRQARPGWSPGAWPGQHQPRRWLLRQRTLATTSIITSPSPNVDSPAQVVTGAGVDRNILRRSCVTSLSGFLPAQRDIIAIITVELTPSRHLTNWIIYHHCNNQRKKKKKHAPAAPASNTSGSSGSATS